jgi:predicted phosphodiesterase
MARSTPPHRRRLDNHPWVTDAPVRYGILADIHANLPALEAAVGVLQRRGVDRFLVAGDLVGYGPFPNECIALVRELDATSIAGNHDLIALGHLSDARCIPLARDTLTWTRGVLHDDAIDYLATLPPTVLVDGRIVVAHGSLDDPQEYVTRPKHARRELDRMHETWPGAQILVLGHTHRVRVWDDTGARRRKFRRMMPIPPEPLLLNPGAVGQSRGLRPLAHFVLLDFDAGEMNFYAMSYDLATCERALVRAGLPPNACHLRPSPRGRLRRIMRRNVRRFRAGLTRLI